MFILTDSSINNNNENNGEQKMVVVENGDLKVNGGFFVPENNAFGHSFRLYYILQCNFLSYPLLFYVFKLY